MRGWIPFESAPALLLPGPGSGRSPAGRAEHAFELVGRGDLELVVAAVPRRLVRPPAHEVGGVAEAGALHVIEGHLAHPLGPERLPAQVLAAAPAAGRPGHALA